MSYQGVDTPALRAWLAARSIARGLPGPIADMGGFRIDTNTDAEVRRWVFPKMGTGLMELARSIVEPRHFLKLCGDGNELRSALPLRWEIHPQSYFMRANGPPPERPLAEDYRIEVSRTGPVIEVRILSCSGDLAASGYAAETSEVFIYDRIVTDAEHRRKGLGHTVMATLRTAKQKAANPELLVATEDGKALYSTLGWETVSPYSTASIGAA